MGINIESKRHSLAHILAQAVQEIYGSGIHLWFWPDIENWFYHDLDMWEIVISDKDLKNIEKKMKQLLRQSQKIEQEIISMDEAEEKVKEMWDPYKIETIKDIKNKWEIKVSFYKNINQKWEVVFDNLCSWPHVENTNQIGENSFVLDKVAWAYWKWDEKNKMLTRIYGFAFDTKEELDKHLKMLVEAKKRDHRIIWAKLKLFTISDLIWPGLPLMQPAWMYIRKEIEDYLWELHKTKWYQRVWSPHIAKECLYETSWHAAKFGDELFRVSGKDEKFILKPMNCPHHMQIFADNQFSYRDMPVRYFEPATVYRDEKSGQLGGLTRVRAITQDDWHLFCRVDQIKAEVKTISDIIKEFYTTLWMTKDYWVSLSVRWEDRSMYLWEDNIWKQAESALESAAKENELPYKRIEWEAAFMDQNLILCLKMLFEENGN